MKLTERSKALYHPWKQESFNADLFVRKMTNVQRWIYKTLLQEAFVCSTRPKLPNNDDLLWIMADCESKTQWLENKEVVLKMFTVEGDLLAHSLLEEDWNRLQGVRASRAEAGQKGGLAKASNCQANSTKEEKEVSKGREEKKENTDSSFQNDGQEDEMKIKKELQAICAGFGESPRGYQSTWEDAQALAVAHSAGAVARDFTEWMNENQGDDFPYGPISKYLQVAHDRLSSNTISPTAAAKDPEVVSLVRELSYLSGGQISFMDKQRARLAEVLKEFSAAEITAAFSGWFSDQDTTDPKNLSFLPGKFVQIVDGLAYAARKTKQESEKSRTVREETARRLQEEAAAERQKREEEQEKEAEIFDPLA